VENLKIVKMEDPGGIVIELFEGNYDPHVAVNVNWFRDEDQNLIEIVEVKP